MTEPTEDSVESAPSSDRGRREKNKSLSRRQKIRATVIVIALVLVLGVIGGVFVDRKIVETRCGETMSSFNSSLSAFNDAKTQGEQFLTELSKSEVATGFTTLPVATDEFKKLIEQLSAASGTPSEEVVAQIDELKKSKDLNDNDKQILKLIDLLVVDHSDLADQAKAPSACEDRHDISTWDKHSEALQSDTEELKQTTTVVSDSFYIYTTVKPLKDATAARDKAISEADKAIKAAQRNEGYTKGFATSDEGKKLIKAVTDAKQAASKVDTDATANTRDEARAVAKKAAPVSEATKKLSAATKQLNDKRKAFEDAKRKADEEAQAARVAEQQQQYSNNYSGDYSGGNDYSGGSNHGSNSGGSYTPPANNGGSSGGSSDQSWKQQGGFSVTGNIPPETAPCAEGSTSTQYIGDASITVKCVNGQWVDID